MTTSDAHRFTIRFPKSMWTALQAHLEDLEKIDGYPTDATTLILKIISGYLRSYSVASNELENPRIPPLDLEQDKNDKSEEKVAPSQDWPPGKGEYIIEMTTVDQNCHTNTREDEWMKLEKFDNLDSALSMIKYYSLLFKGKMEFFAEQNRKFYRITHSGTTLYTMFYVMSEKERHKRNEFFENNPNMVGSSICGQSVSAPGHDRLRR